MSYSICLLLVVSWADGPQLDLEKNLAQLQYPVRSLDFSPDGKLLAVGVQKKVTIFSPKTYEKLAELDVRGTVASVRFHPDGKRLTCTTAKGNYLVVWKTGDWKVEQELKLPPNGCYHCFNSNGEWFALAYPSEIKDAQQSVSVEIWDTKNWQKRTSMEGKQFGVSGIEVSPDDKLVATASLVDLVLWDPNTGKEVRRLVPPKGEPGIGAVAFLPDSKRLVTQGRVWEIPTGKCVLELPQPAYMESGVALSDSVVVSGVGLYDLNRKGGKFDELKLGDVRLDGHRVAWSPKTGLLAAGTRGGIVILYRWKAD